MYGKYTIHFLLNEFSKAFVCILYISASFFFLFHFLPSLPFLIESRASLLFLLLPDPAPSCSCSFLILLLPVPSPSCSSSFLFLLLPDPAPSCSYTFLFLLHPDPVPSCSYTFLFLLLPKYFLGDFLIFFFVLYSALLHLPPSDSTVPTDAGIEPRTVATSALAVRRSNH
jgi:hypothetical protein